MGSLAGKRAFVTAGCQGIGLAISLELLERGCHVAAHYFTSRDGARLVESRAAELGRRCGTIQGDLTREEDARRVAEEAARILGGIDILVNNAGSLVERRPLEKIDPAFWRAVIDVNMHSMIMVTRFAAPYLVESAPSAIVNISSLAGRKGGHAGSLAYAAAKGAVLAWTRGLADELGPRGVRVNAVAPGLILGSSFHAKHTSEESKQKTIASLPVGRAGTCEDVARVVAFLASEYDGFIHGATIDVNGGAYYC